MAEETPVATLSWSWLHCAAGSEAAQASKIDPKILIFFSHCLGLNIHFHLLCSLFTFCSLSCFAVNPIASCHWFLSLMSLPSPLSVVLPCTWFYAVSIPFLVLVGLYCIKRNTQSFFVDMCGMIYGNKLFHWKLSSKDYPSWVKRLFPLFQINRPRKEIFHASLLPLIFQGAPLNENPLFCLTERVTNTNYLV